MAAPKVGINQRSFRQKLAEYRHQPLSLFLLIATLLAAAITVFILFSFDYLHFSERHSGNPSGDVRMEIYHLE